MDEKLKPNPRTAPCPICGSADYVWGVTVGESPSQRLYTRPDGAGWGEGKKMVTRECQLCGNVQLFVEGWWAANE